jgi:hypothetical protein
MQELGVMRAQICIWQNITLILTAQKLVAKGECLTSASVARSRSPRRFPLLCRMCPLVHCSPSARDHEPSRCTSRGYEAWTRYTSDSCTSSLCRCATRNSQSRGIFIWLKTSSMEELFDRNNNHLAFCDILASNRRIGNKVTRVLICY